MPPSRAAAVPGQLRQQIDRWAKAWIDKNFTRSLELRAADPGPFNYPIEVFSEWRGKAFYICARYRAKSRRPQDDFIVRRARMTVRPCVLPAHRAVVHGLPGAHGGRVLRRDRGKRSVLPDVKALQKQAQPYRAFRVWVHCGYKIVAADFKLDPLQAGHETRRLDRRARRHTAADQFDGSPIDCAGRSQ
jgi:hypothetical protein